VSRDATYASSPTGGPTASTVSCPRRWAPPLTGAKTTLLIGDVAFLHDSNGLLGLAGRAVDLTIVVLDNDGGGIFSFLPQRTDLPDDRFERFFGTPHDLDLVAVALAHGVDASSVERVEDLAWEPGTRVLVVTTDRDDNVALHQQLTESVAAAVEGDEGPSQHFGAPGGATS
jgi:2-succinyl-5-enolpyruvyl-6-hydroxy-3-cyclohexene-1-carboxylate synthase